MEIQVYDTYVKNKAGETMHFDVFLDKNGGSLDKALAGAKTWLDSAGETGVKITSEECSFCHVQSPEVEQVKAIEKDGYFIYKMSSNCP